MLSSINYKKQCSAPCYAQLIQSTDVWINNSLPWWEPKTNGMWAVQHSTVMCVMGLPCAQGLTHPTLPFTYPLLFLAAQVSLEEEILFLNP